MAEAQDSAPAQDSVNRSTQRGATDHAPADDVPRGHVESDPEALRARQRDQALKWLGTKQRQEFMCEFCGTNEFAIADVGQIPIYGELISSRVQPVFAIVCQNCGHTLLFNALIAEIEGIGPTKESGE